QPVIPKHCYLPVTTSLAELAEPPQVQVAIVICVYQGLATTQICIESVLTASYRNRPRVIIINDCSPEPELVTYLYSLNGRPAVEVYTNDRNIGYTGSANRGIQLAGKEDVVLLNSDTEVAGDWLDRLIRQAYAAPNIGTVTPFSNNATICSYPTM